MAIKILHLTTGEDFICDVTKDGNVYVLKSPHRILISPQGIGIAPLAPGAIPNQDVRVPEAHVMYELEPEPDFATQVQSQISGLALPPGPRLVTP